MRSVVYYEFLIRTLSGSQFFIPYSTRSTFNNGQLLAEMLLVCSIRYLRFVFARSYYYYYSVCSACLCLAVYLPHGGNIQTVNQFFLKIAFPPFHAAQDCLMLEGLTPLVD